MEALMDGRTSWSFSSTLPVRISGHKMIVDPESNKIYSLGGYDGNKERNEIYMVKLNSATFIFILQDRHELRNNEAMPTKLSNVEQDWNDAYAKG